MLDVRFKVFLSCRFPPSTLASLCISMADAVGLSLVAAERPEAVEIMEKVKAQMRAADGALFLLEPSGKRPSGRMTDWMQAEYGIARAMNKVIGVITSSPGPLPKVFPKDMEYLPVSGLDDKALATKIAGYLYSLRKNLESANAGIREVSNPTFMREFLKHRVHLTGDGRLRYETHVQLQCLRDSLCDVKHSIHTNYSACWPGTNPESWPNLELVPCDSSHTVVAEPFAHDALKYTWKFNIDPSLRSHEIFTYGWRCDLPHYLPLSKAELARAPRTSIPFLQDHVEHHFFINHPTKLLELKVVFDDGSLIGPCTPMAFVGRTFSDRSSNAQEAARIADCLRVEDFLAKKEITLTVSAPRFGYTYAILWTLNR